MISLDPFCQHNPAQNERESQKKKGTFIVIDKTQVILDARVSGFICLVL